MTLGLGEARDWRRPLRGLGGYDNKGLKPDPSSLAPGPGQASQGQAGLWLPPGASGRIKRRIWERAL